MSRPVLFEDLSEEQRQVVATVDGPVLVFSGAGSGKTRVIVNRIAHLIGSGLCRPGEVLAVTFTNKAARELSERLGRMLGPVEGTPPMVGTFHAVCARLLRRHAGLLGYPSGYAILDADDQESVVTDLTKGLGIDARPRQLAEYINRLKNDGLSVDEALAGDGPRVPDGWREIYRRYQARLRENGAMDFGDLICNAVRLLEGHGAVLDECRARWRFIHVDEFQDTNRIQYRLVLLLGSAHRQVCAVGDDDQSIYGWRGARVENILAFEKDFPGARVFTLGENYRSTPEIITVADEVISKGSRRRPKRLFTRRRSGRKPALFIAGDEGDEADFLTREMRLLLQEGYRPGDIAVFYRTNAQSRAIEESLRRKAIAYRVVGGVVFHARREIRDVLAWLSVVRNPADSLRLVRIVNTPARGIGAATLARLEKEAETAGVSLFSVMERPGLSDLVGGGPASRIAGFRDLVRDLIQRSERLPLPDFLNTMLDCTGYLQHLQDLTDGTGEERIRNVSELVNEVTDWFAAAEDRSLGAYLEHAALVSDADRGDDGGERVTLMTIHSAKGLEFPVVFLSGMEEGLLPHANAIDDAGEAEEERRLCYVGITRARERLYFTAARSRRVFGSFKAGRPSRFIDDIPASALTVIGGPATAGMALPSGGLKQWRPAADVRSGRAHPAMAAATGRPPSKTLAEGFHRGSKVVHPVFGAGLVVSVSGSGPNAKLEVMFDGRRLMKVIARFVRPY